MTGYGIETMGNRVDRIVMPSHVGVQSGIGYYTGSVIDGQYGRYIGMHHKTCQCTQDQVEVIGVAREVIRHGGSANLAETDELIGAESYVLQKVKSLETAQRFLNVIARFTRRAAWHGSSAAGNPSGGNLYRGLYNIYLKSLGAAMKRHPEVRLDKVLEYGEPMDEPGYYFMDSPGNDLESVAGQVAAGCNLIYFVTGNGSITNFPFVPTLKIVTTTRRFQLLSRDMDVNAGAYLDGTSMDELGKRMFGLTLDMASGQRSVGEKAGHAQVQLWRNWRQNSNKQLQQLLTRAEPDGTPIPVRAIAQSHAVSFPAFVTPRGISTDRVGLILPTSLCSGQVARMMAERLNHSANHLRDAFSRFVALVHTEGCGVSGGPSQELYVRTMLGYVQHPGVRATMLLEHGCEKTHNDYMRTHIQKLGIDPKTLGWASIQRDGGIDRVMDKIALWFQEKANQVPVTPTREAGLEAIRLGLITGEIRSEAMIRSLSDLTRHIVVAGGQVVIPSMSRLLGSEKFLNQTLEHQQIRATLGFAQVPQQPGLHIMDTPTPSWAETLTGLGATGVDVVVGVVDSHPQPGHPLVPLLQISDRVDLQEQFGADLDLFLDTSQEDGAGLILRAVADTLAHRYTPRAVEQEHSAFQVTRGLLGVSL